MADASLRDGAPANWGQAFATLPLEAPEGGWERVARALPRRAANRHPRRIGWALAAGLAMAVPGAWWAARMAAPGELAPSVAVQDAGDGGSPARPMPGKHVPAHATPQHAARGEVAGAAPRGGLPAPVVSVPEPSTRRVGTRALHRDVARPMVAVAGLTSPRPTPRATPTPEPVPQGADADTASAIAAADELDRLRAESARLEALLAIARDARMASGPAAVMEAALDERIGLIDAALPHAGTVERNTLWQRRVEALGELATLSSTQRWFATHGESMDAVAHVH